MARICTWMLNNTDEQLQTRIDNSIHFNQTYWVERITETLKFKKVRDMGLLNPKKMYDYYKNKFDTTKPIRGRAVECRPIGDRRRDWEKIEMRGDAVACVLYDTDVVTYYPDGRVALRADKWPTPSTADFMWTHSPFSVYKKNKKLWASCDGIQYPIPAEGALEFQIKDDKWAPTQEVVIKKSVIDRKKSKDVYAPMQPFIEHVRVMLMMSDGWIMHDTLKALAVDVKTSYYDKSYVFDIPAEVIEQMGWGFNSRPNVYNYITTCPAEKYTELFLQMTQHNRRWAEESRITSKEEIIYKGHRAEVNNRDFKFSFKAFKAAMYSLARVAMDVEKVIEVQPGQRAMTNVK